MAYANGRIPASKLRRSTIGVDLTPAAANSADRLARAFHKSMGQELRATDGFRPLATQERIFLDRYVPYWIQYAPGRTDARRYKGRTYFRKPGTAAAAVPGTSNHGIGLAVDFASGINLSFTSPTYSWMARNARRYGWTNDEGRSIGEPWHWTYSARLDTHKNLAIIPTFNAAVRREWQRQLGVTVDAIFGTGSISRLQRVLNAKSGHGGFKLKRPIKVDGIDGSRTWMAVQKLLNVWAERGSITLKRPLAVNGKFDARTKMALRKSLNANLWE